MTCLRHAFLAGTTTAAILLGPAVPGGSTQHTELPAGQPVQAAAFSWPLDPPTAILRGFAPPPEPWLPGHRGIDLAARPGQPVLAAGAGTVTFAGPIAGRGVVVVLLAGPVAGHRQLRVSYEPVRSRVHRGDSVRTGDLVGWLEDATRHCGPLGTCLHWGLRRGETYLDPLLLVRPRRVRLLPLDRALASVPARWPPLWTFAQAPGSSQPGPGPADQAAPPAAPDPAMGPVASDHAKTLTAPKQSLAPDAYKQVMLSPMAIVMAVSRAAATLARAELAALSGQAVARIRGSPSASRS